MDVFRRSMAFPMFGTVAWLAWVLAQQAGVDAAGALLGALVALAMLVWALTLAHRARVVVSALALVALGCMAWWTAAIVQAPVPAAQQEVEAGWEPWSPGRVDQLLASGRPVFVDYTAAWCVTCQVNKRTTLSRPEVVADFAGKHVALLRADWTRRDPAITAALAQLGRNGVPVYVFYGVGKAPTVLSELLSVREVRAAIGAL
jgi:thiol:disulfide interchange protein DsbD